MSEGKMLEDFDLDVVDNLVSLCPTCHAFAHNARVADKRDLILRM